MSRAQYWSLLVIFLLVALDYYLILIGSCFWVSRSSICLLFLLFLFERFSCQIYIQLFTDAFCHEIIPKTWCLRGECTLRNPIYKGCCAPEPLGL